MVSWYTWFHKYCYVLGPHRGGVKYKYQDPHIFCKISSFIEFSKNNIFSMTGSASENNVHNETLLFTICSCHPTAFQLNVS